MAFLFGFSDPIETFSTIGIFVTVAVMAVFIGVYIWGTRYNKMLIRRFGAILKTELGPKCEKKKEQVYRSSGFRLYCETKKKVPLKNWEVVLFLLNRENLIHHIISKFRPHHDMLLTTANFLTKPRVRLEIINTTSKEITKEDKETLEGLEKVNAPRMERKFVVKASDPKSAEELFQDDEFVRLVRKLGDDFVRMSVTEKPPHLLFASRARESTLISHVRLAERVGDYFKPRKRKPKILG
ncbi:MAG: hypothetical protein Q6352_013820 [Candidatus Freyrarchaeum guaymaensis]|nr:hypothetical protein [Candidatus Sigynarchaeota archaeon]